MKITEFRLGNLINFESQGIVKEKIIDIQWFIQNENNIDLHFWKPIQITDDFLLRLDTDFTIIKLERGVRVLIFHLIILNMFINCKIYGLFFGIEN